MTQLMEVTEVVGNERAAVKLCPICKEREASGPHPYCSGCYKAYYKGLGKRHDRANQVGLLRDEFEMYRKGINRMVGKIPEAGAPVAREILYDYLESMMREMFDTVDRLFEVAE